MFKSQFQTLSLVTNLNNTYTITSPKVWTQLPPKFTTLVSKSKTISFSLPTKWFKDPNRKSFKPNVISIKSLVSSSLMNKIKLAWRTKPLECPVVMSSVGIAWPNSLEVLSKAACTKLSVLLTNPMVQAVLANGITPFVGKLAFLPKKKS